MFYDTTSSTTRVVAYVNGIKQVYGSGRDFVATTGTSVAFTYNLGSGDTVDIQVYELLTNDAYYLKSEVYTQTQVNSQISTALSGAISPSSATINDIDISRITGANDYTQIKKTSTGSNLAITSQESIYLNIDGNNDQTNRSLIIAANTDTPGGGTVIAKFQEDGNVGIGTTSPATTLTVDGDMSLPAVSLSTLGDSHKLYFGNEVTVGPGKAIFMEDFYMKIQGHRNEGIRLQGVNGSGVVQEFATFYGDANAKASQIILAPTGGNVGIGTGTTSPSDRLVVQHDASGIQPIIVLRNDDTTDDNGVSLDFAGKDTGGNSITYGRIAAKYTNHATEKSHMIFSHRDNNGSFREWMRVNHDGNVGIGETSPERPLHVKGEIYVNHNADNAGVKTSFRALHTSNNTIEIHQFGQSHSNGAVNQIGVSNAEQHLHLVTDTTANVDAGTSTKGIFLRSGGNVGVGNKSPSDKLDIQGADNGLTIRSISANRPVLTLINGSSTMLKISANGTYAAIGDGADFNKYMAFNGNNVGVGTTGPTEKLHVSGTVLASNNIRANGELQAGGSAAIYGSSSLGYAVFSGYRGNYNHMITSRGKVSGTRTSPTFTGAHETTLIEYCNTSASGFYFKSSHTTNYTEICRITTGGVYHQTGTFSSSDISLKDNIEVIPNALDKVKAIRGVSYNRNDLDDNPRQVGVIAQEVEEVLPEVVEDSPDGIKQLAYGNMVALLVEAIKEQDTNYKAEIAELKARLDALEE